MLFGVFSKIQEEINEKIRTGDPTLYITLAFPVIFASMLTFIGSRVVGYLITFGYMPGIFLESSPGLHIHHFTYGFFILFIAGYLGLVAEQPRAKFWTAMLLGFGFGLAIDEFGMWLKLRDDEALRWSFDGLIIAISLFLSILSVRPSIKTVKWLWPSKNSRDGYSGKLGG
jgi:hypothetical protein